MLIRDFGFGARLGLTCLVLVMLGGYIVASALHLNEHYQNRDSRPGLSVTDIEGAYHGVQTEALLLSALRRGHPEAPHDLPEEDRQVLIDWLAGEPNEIRANYDNYDFAELPPEELILTYCSECHSRSNAATLGAGIPLEFFDDVQRMAFSNEIRPTDTDILLASTHAHAPTMAVIAIVIALLAYLSRIWRWLVNLLIFLAGLALLVDLGSWWLSRLDPMWVYGIIGGGGAHSAAMALLMLLIILDLWLPRRHPRGGDAGLIAEAVVTTRRAQE